MSGYINVSEIVASRTETHESKRQKVLINFDDLSFRR